MSQPRQLFLLQQLDSEIDKSQDRIEQIETTLEDNTLLQQARAQAEKAEKHYQQAQIALKRAEQDVETQQAKISNNERALYGGSVTNPKELEDLQMESGALKRHLSTLEDKLLEKMVSFEAAEKQDMQAKAYLAATRDQVAKENTSLTEERDQLLAKVDTLSQERTDLAAPIDEDTLALYNKLRQTKAGAAVSEVVDGACAACGVTLTAAQAQAARSPSKITICDSCRRILYST